MHGPGNLGATGVPLTIPADIAGMVFTIGDSLSPMVNWPGQPIQDNLSGIGERGVIGVEPYRSS